MAGDSDRLPSVGEFLDALYCEPACRYECELEECKTPCHPGGCNEKSTGLRYICCRKAGHRGPHVACGTHEHALAVWPRRKRGRK